MSLLCGTLAPSLSWFYAQEKSCGTAGEMKVSLRHWVSEGIPLQTKINREADVVTTAEHPVWLLLQCWKSQKLLWLKKCTQR